MHSEAQKSVLDQFWFNITIVKTHKNQVIWIVLESWKEQQLVQAVPQNGKTCCIQLFRHNINILSLAKKSVNHSCTVSGKPMLTHFDFFSNITGLYIRDVPPSWKPREWYGSMLSLPHRESVAFPQENRSTGKASAKHQLHATHVVPAGWKRTVWGILSRHPLHFCMSEGRRRRRERSAASGAIWRLDNLQVPQNFHNCSTGYNFREAYFHIPRLYSETYGKHSLRYLGPKLWK